MVRNRRALMLLKSCAAILSVLLCVSLLVGCIANNPPRDDSENTTEAEEESTWQTETDTHEAETGFPNEPEDGHTKRY